MDTSWAWNSTKEWYLPQVKAKHSGTMTVPQQSIRVCATRDLDNHTTQESVLHLQNNGHGVVQDLHMGGGGGGRRVPDRTRKHDHVGLALQGCALTTRALTYRLAEHECEQCPVHAEFLHGEQAIRKNTCKPTSAKLIAPDEIHGLKLCTVYAMGVKGTHPPETGPAPPRGQC